MSSIVRSCMVIGNKAPVDTSKNRNAGNIQRQRRYEHLTEKETRGNKVPSTNTLYKIINGFGTVALSSFVYSLAIDCFKMSSETCTRLDQTIQVSVVGVLIPLCIATLRNQR